MPGKFGYGPDAGKKGGPKMKYGTVLEMGHSPTEMSPYKMGHDSPAQNHHYGMRKGESIKQEKYNLMHDDPVAKDASGGRDMSWMSKHSKSAMMMKGSMEMEDKGSPAGKHCM
tara:strand:+ start:4703 stop:5041 length:339 start_codon:yes stop_codon:yes gene_type:complete